MSNGLLAQEEEKRYADFLASQKVKPDPCADTGH
jgi:hypothetical protein